MNKDTIINHLVDKHDSLKIILSSDKSSAIQDDFDFTKTLVTALIGAIIGQVLILFIGWVKNHLTRKDKKKLIVDDLTNQLKVLSRLVTKLNELDKKFEKRDALNNTSDTFQDLQTDIYESVPKTDLHKIFKTDIFKLVDIYKSIEFLKVNSIVNIHITYLQKLEIHTKEKASEPNHDFYCTTHMQFIDTARSQIKNNLGTISDISKEMNEIIKSYG